MRFLIVFVLAIALPSWSNVLRQGIEKARYLFEIEGDAAAALVQLNQLRQSATHDESQDVDMLIAEIWFAQGKKVEAKALLTQSLAKSDWDRTTLRKAIHRIGVDSSPQPTVLGMHSWSKLLDTILMIGSRPFVAQNDGSLYSLDSNWKPESARLIHKGQNQKVLFGDGVRIFLWDSLSNILKVVRLDHSQEEKQYHLGSKIRWHKVHGDVLLIWSGDALWSFRGSQALWKWKSDKGYCEASKGDVDQERLLLFCPTSKKVVALDPLHQKWEVQSLVNEPMGIVEMPQAFLLLDAKGIALWTKGKRNRELWRQEIGFAEEALVQRDKVYVRAGGLWRVLDLGSGLQQGKTQLPTGRLLGLGRDLLLWRTDGQVVFLEENLGIIWRYHAGKRITQEPLVQDGLVRLITEDRKWTILNGHYSGLLPSERDLLAQRAQSAFDAKKILVARENLDQLLSLEPGSAKALILSDLIADKSMDPQAMYKEYLLGKDDPGVLENVLPVLARSMNAEWVAPMDLRHAAYPQLRVLGKNVYWVHPEQGLLRSYDSRTGRRNTIRSLRANPSSFQSFDAEGQQIAVLSGQKIILSKSLGQSTPVQQYVVGEAPVWIGFWRGRLLVVDRWGGLTFRSSKIWDTLQSLNNAIAQDPVAQILRFPNAVWVLHYSGIAQKIMDLSEDLESSKMRLGGRLTDACSAPNGFLAVVGTRLEYRDFEGRILWRTTVPSGVVSMNAQGSKVVLGMGNQSLLAYDLKDGHLVWSFQGKNSLLVRPQLHKNKVYLDQGQTVAVLDIHSGRLLETRRYPFRVGSVQALDKKVYVTSASGLMIAHEH
jgi:hypothetical protein